MQNVMVHIPYMDDTVDGRNPAPVEIYKTNFTQESSFWFVPLICEGEFLLVACYKKVATNTEATIHLRFLAASHQVQVRGSRVRGSASSPHKVDQIMTDMDSVHRYLGGGNSNIFYFHPENRGNDSF